MKRGDNVYVIANCVCYAPVESIGQEGVIVGEYNGLINGVRYTNKFEVLFLDPVFDRKTKIGYATWLFDESELCVVDDIPVRH